MFTYLEKIVRHILSTENQLHILENAIVRDSVKVFKSCMAPINEKRLEVSSLDLLWKLANNKIGNLKDSISPGSLMEFIALFKAVIGKSNIYWENGEVKSGIPDFLKKKGRDAANARMDILDDLGLNLKKYFKNIHPGLTKKSLTGEKIIKRAFCVISAVMTPTGITTSGN